MFHGHAKDLWNWQHRSDLAVFGSDEGPSTSLSVSCCHRGHRGVVLITGSWCGLVNVPLKEAVLCVSVCISVSTSFSTCPCLHVTVVAGPVDCFQPISFAISRKQLQAVACEQQAGANYHSSPAYILVKEPWRIYRYVRGNTECKWHRETFINKHGIKEKPPPPQQNIRGQLGQIA